MGGGPFFICHKKRNSTKKIFRKKVIVWLGFFSRIVSRPVIFEEKAVNHDRDIKEVLPDLLKFGNYTFGSHWVFEQDGTEPRFHAKLHEWCANNFPRLLIKIIDTYIRTPRHIGLLCLERIPSTSEMRSSNI